MEWIFSKEDKQKEQEETLGAITKLNALFYLKNDQKRPLPSWARWFINLGAAMGQTELTHKRCIVAVSVPTRAFAAAFLSAGIICSRIANCTRKSTIQAHFESLCSLPVGTSLLVRQDDRIKKGIFDGDLDYEGKHWIRVKIEAGATLFIGQEQSVRVEVTAVNHFNSLPKKQKGRLILPRHQFIKNIVGEDHLADFASTSNLECAIVGRIGKLRDELKNVSFALRISKSRFVEGSFADLLRVRKFVGNGKHYKSEIYPIIGTDCIAPPCLNTTVVFDGSSSFIKCRHSWKNNNCLVILDRTETRFSDATEVINQDYVKKRVSDDDWLAVKAIPDGIEMISYVEKRG